MKKYLQVFPAAFLIIAFQLACAPESGPTPEEKQNLEMMQRIYEEFVNQGKEEVFDELVAEDVVEHEELPGFEPNKAGVKQFFQMFRSAFPDLHFTVDDIFAAGDKVVSRITITGTHQGEYMGIPATGNKIEVKGIDIVRFADGKIKDHWGITDTMTMMQQLGQIPAEPKEEEDTT